MKLPSCKLDLIHIHMFIESISFSFQTLEEENKKEKKISDIRKDEDNEKGNRRSSNKKSIVNFTNFIQQTTLPSYNNI